MSDTGNLFIVATPIGNLSDITLRAVDILKKVHLIAAEDTRHCKILLNHYNITTPTMSLHNFNEKKMSQIFLQKLQTGKNIALISDAGTPLICDPGFALIKIAREHNLKIIPIPGTCAAITALCVSGLPADKFIFEGFLPSKTKKQLDRLRGLANELRTIIFYEAPHRLLTTIKNMQAIFGNDRQAVIAKELTKTFETVYCNKLSEIELWISEHAVHQKGEFVILVKGTKKDDTMNYNNLRILDLLKKHMPQTQAIALTSKITGIKKNMLYKFKHQN